MFENILGASLKKSEKKNCWLYMQTSGDSDRQWALYITQTFISIQSP